jgi:sodium-dependent dicarboxylate transporter 2/3/5
MALVAVWMAWWWLTESMSLYITALLPLALYPLLGIMPMADVAPVYSNETIFLFTGGFLIAFALERHGLHHWFGSHVLRAMGTGATQVLWGVMLASYCISMWVSNIATTMMLLPAVLAITAPFAVQGRRATAPFLLGLAYASSIGGTATLVGTAPNVIFLGYFTEHYPHLPQVSFTDWLAFALPASVVMLIGSHYALRWVYRDEFRGIGAHSGMAAMVPAVQPLTAVQVRVLMLFGLTVLLWVFRADIDLGRWSIPGWSGLLPYGSMVRDSTVAMAMALLMFVVPEGQGRGALLHWDDAKRLPLGILFLFGGGFALASGLEKSGLSMQLVRAMSGLEGASPLLVVVAMCTFMTFFTELTSNTASTYLILPVLAGLSDTLHIPPAMLMMPVVISASFAFMLPVGTPPNTVVFSTEAIDTRDMARAGLLINLLGIAVMAVAVWAVM